MKSIELIVSPQGEIMVETRGYVGAECEAASGELIDALGAIVEQRRTAAFFATAQPAHRQHLDQRAGGTP